MMLEPAAEPNKQLGDILARLNRTWTAPLIDAYGRSLDQSLTRAKFNVAVGRMPVASSPA